MGPQDVDEAAVRVALVQKQRLADRVGQFDLRLEAVLLLRAWGEVAIEVEAALAHGYHGLVRGQLPQHCQGALAEVAGLVRVHARSAVERTGPSPAQGQRVSAPPLAGAGDDE